MQFLAPLWLALGAAASVPLLLHLWRQRTGRPVVFPGVRFLLTATEARGAALRFSEWLLLALRVLAVLLLAVAAARPATRGGVGARGPAALVLVLDNSLSTSAVVGGRSVLDALREQLGAALDALGPGDQAWLVTADGTIVAGTPATVRAALAAVRPLAGAGDVPAALRRATLLAAGRPAGTPRPGVVLATDAQATTWARAVALPGVRLGVVRAGGRAPADRGVLAADADPARWNPDGVVTGRTTGAGPWTLTLRDSAGREAAVARGSTVATDSFALRAALRPTARGWLTGTLQLPPDELRGDDVRHLAVFVGPPPQLAADASAGPFGALGVATLQDARIVGPATPGAPQVTEPLATTRRPVVLVAPADPARLPAANRALDRLGIPWRFGARVDAGGVATFTRRPRPDRSAPDVAEPGIPVARRWRLDARGVGGQSVGRTDTLAAVGGDPWIVAGDGYVLLAAPLDTTWTAFPARAAFLPWLADAADRIGAGSAPSRPTRAAPGAPVEVPAGADALGGPGGPRAVGGATNVARIAAPAEPGVYFWLRTGARIGALVVDPEAEEVVLARLDAKELQDRLRVGTGGAVDVHDRGAAAVAFALGTGGTRALGPWLAAVAALLLAGESFAARARRSA